MPKTEGAILYNSKLHLLTFWLTYAVCTQVLNYENLKAYLRWSPKWILSFKAHPDGLKSCIKVLKCTTQVREFTNYISAGVQFVSTVFPVEPCRFYCFSGRTVSFLPDFWLWMPILRFFSFSPKMKEWRLIFLFQILSQLVLQLQRAFYQNQVMPSMLKMKNTNFSTFWIFRKMQKNS